VSHGVTCVTSAGSYSADAGAWSPACVPGVLAVATLADSDGLPGGLGSRTPYGPDDTFASFSNYSNDPAMVDLIAPGVNIYSTWLNGGYSTQTNGNCSQAYVAGAAALYLSTHPGASPADVRTALITAPEVQQIPGIHGETRTYPLVNVSSF
jgi:subtilisin